MLSNARLGKQLWAEALEYTYHLINGLSSSAIGGKTPMEVWSRKPATNYDSLHIFGCSAYYHVKESKLDPRAKKALFMGITSRIKRFCFWRPEMRKGMFSRDETFDEYPMMEKLTNEAVQTSSTLPKKREYFEKGRV